MGVRAGANLQEAINKRKQGMAAGRPAALLDTGKNGGKTQSGLKHGKVTTGVSINASAVLDAGDKGAGRSHAPAGSRKGADGCVRCNLFFNLTIVKSREILRSWN